MLVHRAKAVRAVVWIMLEYCVVVVELRRSGAWKCIVTPEWISSPRQTILLVPWRLGFLIVPYYSTRINFCVWWLLTVFMFKTVRDLKSEQFQWCFVTYTFIVWGVEYSQASQRKRFGVYILWNKNVIFAVMWMQTAKTAKVGKWMPVGWIRFVLRFFLLVELWLYIGQGMLIMLISELLCISVHSKKIIFI